VIIVDDRLSVETLAGRFHRRDGPVATTWTFHFRLMRALADDSRVGRLTGASSRDLRALAASPPAGRLLVLDPRMVTAIASDLAMRHGLNMVGAELLASAVEHSATVVLSAGNVGRTWPEVFSAEGVRWEVTG